MIKENMEVESVKVPVDFDDLITERKQESWRKVAYVDSVRLEEAIASGRLTDEVIAKKLGTWTLQGKLQQVEKELENLKIKPLDDGGRHLRLAEKDRDAYLAMQAARSGYIPITDNLRFHIRSANHEQLANDFTDWLVQRDASVETTIANSVTLDQVRERLKKVVDDTTDDDMEKPLHIELSLDYPNLNHAMQVQYIGKEEAEAVLYGLFYSHAYGKEKISCNADLLSVLKVMNHFKRTGYKAQVLLAMNPASDKGEKIYFVAR